MDTNIENALNRLIKHAGSLKDIKDLLELYNEIKGIKMTIMLQLDYIRDQKEYEKV